MTRAVSTWSLHRTLGRFVADESAATGGPFMPQRPTEDGIDLLDLPPLLRDHGFDTLQIVHFHLPATDSDYLGRLRSALDAAGIALDCLLIDDGDLTDTANAGAIAEWVDGYLTVAEQIGAKRARVIGGRSRPDTDGVEMIAATLRGLAERHPRVRVVFENWLGLFPDPDAVVDMLDRTDGKLGLLIDLGNWTGPDKYAQLERIAPHAETCHAKCRFTADGPDAADYRRCLGILKDAGFAGPLALIYDGPNDDEWAMLDVEDEMVRDVFA